MQAAKEEGLIPVMQWIKNTHDMVIARFFDPGYELVWQDDEATDPLTKAQINQIYLAPTANGLPVLHPDEVRIDLGLDPFTEKQKADFQPPEPTEPPTKQHGDVAGEQNQQGKSPVDANKKPNAAKAVLAKAKKPVAAPMGKPHVEKAITKAEKLIAGILTDAAKQAAASIEKMQKASGGNDDYGVDWEGFDDSISDGMYPYLASVATVSALQSLDALGIDDDDLIALLRQSAVDYAKERSAEMVGKRIVNGLLVDNPDSKWSITQTTRDALRDMVAKSAQEGWTGQELAGRIRDDFAFSQSRASMIARTEMAFADLANTVEGWKQSGVVESKMFHAAPDCCDTCQDYDGETVGLDDDFSWGDTDLPHPHCRCSYEAGLKDEGD